MRRILALGLAGAGASAVVLVGMPGSAIALTSTKTTITQHHAGSRPGTLEMRGVLQPAPAFGEKMVVKYYKKNANGTWTKLDAQHPGLSAPNSQQMAQFAATFTSPTSGVCKLVAKYRGDDTYAASKAVAKIQCRSGQPA
jgi:hypothetical protein